MCKFNPLGSRHQDGFEMQDLLEVSLPMKDKGEKE